MAEITYIGIGSNLNNPKRQVIEAIAELSQLPNSRLLTQSSLYLSPPMGSQDQDHYINAMVKLSSQLSAIELLDQLQSIENSHGRVRKTDRWGARTLDLDLILYGNHVIDEPRLHVPHYGMKQRSFVLVPLAEIEPKLILPDGSRLTELIAKLTTPAAQHSGNQGIQKL